jgi:ABC-type transport system substrate-binding protein
LCATARATGGAVRKPLVALAVLAISALSTGVAAPAGMAGTSAAKPLRMTVATLGTMGSLDPRRGNSVIAREVWNLQYPTLTALNPATLDPTAGVASGWSPRPDRRGWRYSLRRNLTWSDGKPLTATDVVYSLDRARDDHWPYAIGMLDSLTSHAVDPHTVAVRSTSADRPAPGLLLHIVPAHIYSKIADVDADTTALGVADGVWHVVSKSPDSVELDVLGRPAGPPLDQIVFRTYPNADALIDALSSGRADVISGVPDADIGRLETMAGVTVNHAGDGTEYVLRFTDFPDARLRRVVSLAIDRTELVADVVHGVGTPVAIDARPGWARQALLELDPNHDLVPVIAIPTDPTSRRVGAFVRKNLAAVGLQTRVMEVGTKKGNVRANLALERVAAREQPTNSVGLFQPDILQAFRTDNVAGFLREPAQRSLVAFGPTTVPYGAIVAAQPPPGEHLSNIRYAIGAAILLALCAVGYWIASLLRKRFAS